jgi:DNA-binding transcriptional MerR regulator
MPRIGARDDMIGTDRYTVGEFAQVSGISAKALRFYDKVGLFRPATVEVGTRYRRYSLHQLQELGTILRLSRKVRQPVKTLVTVR